MRTAWINTLQRLADKDPNLFLLVGDLGYTVVEDFAQAHPRQYVNVGIAEQHMTGLAAGLALSGKTVFTYSIANFPVLRCLEQIRNDVCYHNANVKIVAIGGGYTYGSLGATHHGTEDLAVMRALPNMTVVAPGDPVEARLATEALARRPGPGYLRLGKAGETVVHTSEPAFELGKAIRLRQGGDVTIFSTGGVLPLAVEAADVLGRDGIATDLWSVHTLKPLDAAAIVQSARKTGAVLTVEEHNVIGGLGGAVAETLLEQGTTPCRFRRIGVGDRFAPFAGSRTRLRTEMGITAEAVAEAARALLATAT